MQRHISTVRQVADDLVSSQFAIAIPDPSYTIAGVYVVDALIARNYTKRFIWYDTNAEPLTGAEALALHFRDTLKTLDAQIAALATAALADFDPLTDFSRSRTYYETAGNTKETTYGKTDTRAGNNTVTTTYNSNTTNDVVTFDATLRDNTKSTRGGSDTSAGMDANTSTLSGKDTTTDDGDRSIIENVTGNNRNMSENLAKYLDVKLRDDVLDFVLSQFERRYLFYGGE